jgi:predicted house-cleaning noncanonical NTP pyrophosphatase (MazG superfamily)
MTMQPPPAPSITPRQMNLLRIVASMAWSDGHLAPEEIDLMLDRFSRLFATDSEQQHKLQEELHEYLHQNIPIERLIPKLETQAERELVLFLGYEVICSSSRTPDEPKINSEEAAAYERLVQLINLPPEIVENIEAEAAVSAAQSAGLIDILAVKLEEFIRK